MAERDKRRVIVEMEPVLAIEKMEAKPGRWVASGRISIPIARGDETTLGGLEFPFHDAENREDAIGQVVDQLEAVIAELSNLTGRIRGTADVTPEVAS